MTADSLPVIPGVLSCIVLTPRKHSDKKGRFKKNRLLETLMLLKPNQERRRCVTRKNKNYNLSDLDHV